MGRERCRSVATSARGFAAIATALAALAGGPPAAAAADAAGPIDDGRDPYTLFYRHPVNRQLAAQLNAPDQDFRWARGDGRPFGGRWTYAADLSTASEQPATGATRQARFHGYYLADIYLAAHLVDGLEANLNLLLFNASASDGYRAGAHLATGLALHAWAEILRIRDRPLRLDVFGPDLGWLTLGAGLLLEQLPAEGVTARLAFEDTRLTFTFAGRALWPEDDVLRTELSALAGRVGIMWVDWRFASTEATGPSATYLGAYLKLPLPGGLRVAAEVAARPRQGHQIGALARADYLGRPRPWIELHTGYQFRWYQAAFGPRDGVVHPTAAFSTPQQEDVYVTNSFEFLGVSSLHDQ